MEKKYFYMHQGNVSFFNIISAIILFIKFFFFYNLYLIISRRADERDCLPQSDFGQSFSCNFFCFVVTSNWCKNAPFWLKNLGDVLCLPQNKSWFMPMVISKPYQSLPNGYSNNALNDRYGSNILYI